MWVSKRVAVVVLSLLSFNAVAQQLAVAPDDIGPVTAAIADSGTNGDVFMSSPAPYPWAGVLLQAKPNWPWVVAKTGSANSWSGFMVTNSADAELMRVRSDGYVGIGTAAPEHKLDLVGNMRIRHSANSENAAFLSLSGTNSTGAEYKWTHVAGSSGGMWGVQANAYEIYEYPRNQTPMFAAARFRIRPVTTAGNIMFTINGNGNVGIRTPAEYAGLEIAAGNATTNTWNAPSSYQGFLLTNYNDASMVMRTLAGGIGQLTTDAAGRSLSFATGQFVEAVRIDPSGRVGIGTPTPNYKLEVVGDAHFSGTVSGGNIQAKYQDVAEWVPARENLTPGTVVVLDTAAHNTVLASSTAYDTKVAGVVSAQPGIILGEEGTGREQIATTGRVRVRVDATRAPIAVGDLLVTSGTQGVAMKSEPMEIRGRQFHQPGTIIGKALEPLAGGEGEILVLLSLQ